MNFAEQLINWRNSTAAIQKSEKSIKKIISLRCDKVMNDLMYDGVKTDISILEFDIYKFCSSIYETLYDQFNKVIDVELLKNLIIEQLYSYSNIFIFNSNDFIKNDTNSKFIVLYKKDIENSPQELFNILQYIFYEYMLPDFEKRYKEKNELEITFSHHFSVSYSIEPIEKLIKEMGITEADAKDILDIFSRLAKISGMTFYESFTLGI